MERTDGRIAVVQERLQGIDKATELLNETVNRVPTDLQKAIAQMRELLDVRFDSVALQFKERDTRSERESRDNKVAVDAAFAAQKEAAAKQDEANQKAIDKSEKATNESISKLGEVVKASNDALADKIDDVKARLSDQDSKVTSITASRQGGQDATVERRQSNAAVYAAMTIGVTMILAVLTIVAFVLANVGR
jgi:DNA anti-recombination protein RmuC